MKTRKSGKRHRLLVYRRTMDRLWLATLVLGLLLGVIWWWFWAIKPAWVNPEGETWLLAGSIFSLCFALFAFLTRNTAYVQPYRDHLRLVTPFLRLKISYNRIRSVHPSAFQQLFPPAKASWAQRRLLEPFYRKTVVVVDLTSYPMSPYVLRFFLSPQMFSPQSTGFVLLVPDWMDFSTELDSLRSAWGQAKNQPTSRLGKSW
jgi:hypothetical protein